MESYSKIIQMECLLKDLNLKVNTMYDINGCKSSTKIKTYTNEVMELEDWENT
jgi:hypothetical protein